MNKKSSDMNSSSLRKDQLLSGDLPEKEYAPYYQAYIELCGGEYLFKCLRDGKEKFLAFAATLTNEKAHYRYEDNKWSLKEVIGHMTDTERIMAFRALSFARGETGEFPGYDHNAYVDEAKFDNRPLNDLLTDYIHVRESTMDLFESFSPEMLLRTGTASQCIFSVRALGFIIAGHERHHMKVIKDMYMPGLR